MITDHRMKQEMHHSHDFSKNITYDTILSCRIKSVSLAIPLRSILPHKERNILGDFASVRGSTRKYKNVIQSL